MEEDKFFDPVNVSLFDIAGLMFDSAGVPHLVQQLFGAALHILYSQGLLERSQDRIIIFSRL